MADIPWLNTAIQITSGIIVVILLYILTLVVLNTNSMAINANNIVKSDDRTMIVSGVATSSYLAARNFNTVNQYMNNFRLIGKSINTQGGAQFTYQFWIKLNSTNDTDYTNQVVLMKGDPGKYYASFYDSNNLNIQFSTKPDTIVTCPLIKFVDSYRHLQVNFNTQNGPLPLNNANNDFSPSIDILMNPEADASHRNLLSLLPINWFLFTFVFKDNFDSTQATETGIQFQFYINDMLYQSNGPNDTLFLKNNSLKQNDGDLFILPYFNNRNYTAGTNLFNLGDIAYYNYAIPASKIKSTFAKGPPTNSAMLENESTIDPAFISAYNKLDIYNF